MNIDRRVYRMEDLRRLADPGRGRAPRRTMAMALIDAGAAAIEALQSTKAS
jgi:hypothetical protein